MHWKQYRSVIVLFMVSGFLVSVVPSAAETEVVYASYKYVMGDNDTKNDAKRICFLEAKRRCLEKVGTYIESETKVRNFKLTKDEIRTYATALTKVEVANEKIKFEGESITIFMTVKAEVDMRSVSNQLSEIMQDKFLQKKLKEQNIRLQELERKYTQLQKELNVSNPSKALELRKDRASVFDEIESIEARYKHISRLRADRRLENSERVKRILAYIEIGMTPQEVEYILGKGERKHILYSSETMRSFSGSTVSNTNKNNLYYDDVRIMFSKRNTVGAIEVICSTNIGIPIKTPGYNIMKNGIHKHPCREGSRMPDFKDFFSACVYCLPEIQSYVFGQ